MVRTRGPTLSVKTSGSIGGALTFAENKGRSYARKLGKPSQPRSDAQTGQRAMMGFISKQWSLLLPAWQQTWATLGWHQALSSYHAYVKENSRRWSIGQYPSITYPASGVSGVATSITLTPTARLRTIELTPAYAVLNNNWGIVIHRSTSTGFTPNRTNAITTIGLSPLGIGTYVDGPLEPATYYYRATPFTIGAVEGAPSAEESAVIP